MTVKNTFGELFKKYRLKAEIPTLSKFGQLLAEKGFNYEDSIFSHWQNGSRIPQYRTVLLKLLEIFLERGAITSQDQANEFLESANQGYLSEAEIKKFHFDNSAQTPFQIPSKIANFSGRQEIIIKLKKQLRQGNIVLLHGPPGVGKTALAIQSGYLLKKEFPDGILWFRLDTSDAMDILLAIAYAFGKDISHIQDKEIRASVVRSLLLKKRVLLIFDNAESNKDIRLLLPNAKNCSVILTSRNTTLPIDREYKNIPVLAFNHNEVLFLFEEILGENYLNKHRSEIVKLAKNVGNLPLALQIFARQIKQGSIIITELINLIDQDKVLLEDLGYENKNLFAAIEVSFNLLGFKRKELFITLAVFDGKDFSVEAVSFINEFSLSETKKLLEDLKNASLIEDSTNSRYRIHPMIKKFICQKLNNPKLFLKASKYYIEFLAKFDKTSLKSYPNIKQESDNVLYIFKKCYELQYWNDVIVLWDPLENLLYATRQLNKMRYIYQIVRTQERGTNTYQKILIIFFSSLIIYWLLINFGGIEIGFWHDFYSFSFGLMSFIGGIFGFLIARSWGLFYSSIGKAIFFLSAGLFSWGMGSNIWSYYNFFHDNPAPYPSLAELGYMPAYLFWTIGMIYLPHGIGGNFNILKNYRNLAMIVIPLLVLSVSYFLLVLITKSNIVFNPITSPIKLFFDIAYPAGDAVILTTALIFGISFKFFGGNYKVPIYAVLLGFCFQYVADFLFTYAITAGIYHNGYMGDLFFTIGVFLITYGVLGFYFKTRNNFSKKL